MNYHGYLNSTPVFPATRWTLITTAAQQDSAAAEEALNELCRAYWYPLYAFVRHQGHSPDEAQDLTQEFFTRFLEKRYIAAADPARGRFRSFVLSCMKHFLCDAHDRSRAQKRGGGSQSTALDLSNAEELYAGALGHGDTPERLFEREWARTLVARVITSVRLSLSREGRADSFERLQHFLPGSEVSCEYSDVAQQLGMSENSVKVAVHRLRRRFRETFRAEIAHLVSNQTEVDDEIRVLLTMMRT